MPLKIEQLALRPPSDIPIRLAFPFQTAPTNLYLPHPARAHP
jgi:hypothetical protein